MNRRQSLVRKLKLAEQNIRELRDLGDIEAMNRASDSRAKILKVIQDLDKGKKSLIEPLGKANPKTRALANKFANEPKPQEENPINQILLGQNPFQKNVGEFQKNTTKLYSDTQDILGLNKIQGPEFFTSTLKSLLNPASITQPIASIISNPSKFMDENIYNTFDSSKSPEERLSSAINSLFLIGSLAGAGATKSIAKSAEKGLFKQLKKLGYDINKADGLNRILETTGQKLSEKAKSVIKNGIQKINAYDQARFAKGGNLPSRQSGTVNFGPKPATKEEIQQQAENVTKNQNISPKNVNSFNTLSNVVFGDNSEKAFDIQSFLKKNNLTLDELKEKYESGKFNFKNAKLNDSAINYNEFTGQKIKFRNQYKTAFQKIFAEMNSGNKPMTISGELYIIPKQLSDILKNVPKQEQASKIKKFFNQLQAPIFKTEARQVEQKAPELYANLVTSRRNIVAQNALANKKIDTDIYTNYKSLVNDKDFVMDVNDFLESQTKFDSKAWQDKINSITDPNKRKFYDDLKMAVDSIEAFNTQLPKSNRNNLFETNLKDGIKDLTKNLGPKINLKNIENPNPLAILSGLKKSNFSAVTLAPEYLKRKAAVSILGSAEFKKLAKDDPVFQNNIASLAKSLDSVNKEILSIAPSIDIEIGKALPALPKLAEIARKLSSGAQIGGNLSTALSQTIPLTFSVAKNGLINTTIGLGKALKNDPIFEKSAFLTTRRLANEPNSPLYKSIRSEMIKNNPNLIKKIYEQFGQKVGENIIDGILGRSISTIDNLISKTLWSSSYQRVKGSLGDQEAIDFADNITEKLMAGRGLGDKPEAFNSVLGSVILQYGLEPLNQPQVFKEFFTDRTGSKGKKLINGVTSLSKFAVSSYLLNNAIERINGRRPAFDLIGIAEDVFMKENKGTSETQLPGGRMASKPYTKNVGQTILQNVTGISGVDVGNLPSFQIVKNIIPGVDVIKNIITKDPKSFFNLPKEKQTQLLYEFGKQIVSGSVKGGTQLKKTIEGIQSLLPEGYYDPKYTNLKDKIKFEEDIDAYLKKAENKELANKLEMAKNNVKVEIAPENLIKIAQTLIFGPKSSAQYKSQQAETYNYEEKNKRLRSKAEKYRKIGLDDLARLIENSIKQGKNPEIEKLNKLK